MSDIKLNEFLRFYGEFEELGKIGHIVSAWKIDAQVDFIWPSIRGVPYPVKYGLMQVAFTNELKTYVRGLHHSHTRDKIHHRDKYEALEGVAWRLVEYRPEESAGYLLWLFTEAGDWQEITRDWKLRITVKPSEETLNQMRLMSMCKHLE